MALALVPQQAQRQSISPAMWMGLNLLALPIGELKEAVKKEVESNPALEAVRTNGRVQTGLPTADYIDNLADDRGETLDEHLMGELRMSGVAGRDERLYRAIVSELDENGRFTGSMPDLQMQTGATADELERARQLVMTIDPKGCGARDLVECYRAQLGSLPVSQRQLAEVAIDELAKALSGPNPSRPKFSNPSALVVLKKLDPFPGRLYDHRKTEYVAPDIVVDTNGDVDVDQGDIPELQVSGKYVAMAKDSTLDAETRKYAAERVQRAKEFREAVIRRRETVEKIAELAIGGQPDFLGKGVCGLRKQTMGEVAKQAKCNVATVSRAAARKYVKTPHGVLPLRKFFAVVDQEPIEQLRQLIAAVPEGETISDRQLSEQLAKRGVKMARRTVAKYRQRLSLK